MEEDVRKIIEHIAKDGRSDIQKSHIQHGTTTVFDHSVNVAITSLRLSEKLNAAGIRVNRRELIRGALLHDYFLYDWHEKDRSHSWHGFRHPATALKNARNDFELTRVEEDIISRHMFPPVSYTHLDVYKRQDEGLGEDSGVRSGTDSICFMQS